MLRIRGGYTQLGEKDNQQLTLVSYWYKPRQMIREQFGQRAWHRSFANGASGDRSCHHLRCTDVFFGACTSAIISPVHLPFVLEPLGSTVFRRYVALLEKAPSRSTEPLLLGFLQ